MCDWRPIPVGGFPESCGHFLLWHEAWVDDDFNPSGVRDGWFQEGDNGEAYFGVADFCADQDCYFNREIYDQALWPTHYAEKSGPAVV